MNQRIRFCTSFDGTSIAFNTAGNGPPVVRVAAWLSHLELDRKGPIWEHWFEELCRNRMLIRYDQRGCGLSDREVDDISFEAWVRDLEAVIDELGIEHFSLLGLSQGGPIAVAYAARNPERVNNLVLCGSYTHGAFAEGVHQTEKQKAYTLLDMIKFGWGQQNAAFRKVFVNLLMPGGSEEQQNWLAELERQSTNARTAARLWKAFHEIDIRELATQVQNSTMIFHVKNDAMVPFEQGCQLASLIPNAQFIPLEGENHIVQHDEPAWTQIVAELQRFFAHKEDTSYSEIESFYKLTNRECEVLNLIARGLNNIQIAEQLFISPKTVRNHATRIFSKLQVHHRAEAIVKAREAGLGKIASE